MKISELPLTTSVTGSEILPIVQGGTTKKVSISDALAGAGGGGVNPTSEFIPYNNGGTFQDSFLFNGNAGELTTKPAGTSYGLKLDFANNYFYFGDFDNVYSGPYIQINSNSGAQEFKVTSPSYFDSGLKLDFVNNTHFLGDYQNGKGTKIDLLNNTYEFGDYSNSYGFKYDSANLFFSIGNYNQFDIGIDLASKVLYLGDWNGISNGTAISINDNTQTANYSAGLMHTFYCQNGAGLQMNGNNGITLLGDFAGTYGTTSFGVDDSNHTLLASSVLLTALSGSSSGQHLKIKVGGTDYVIELKNP